MDSNNLHRCFRQHGSLFLLPVHPELCTINLLYDSYFQDSPLIEGEFYIPNVLITSICFETGVCDGWEFHVTQVKKPIDSQCVIQQTVQK